MWFSSTGGTVSEDGKQQRYKTSVFLAEKEGWLQEGGSTWIRRESRRHPEIRAGTGPANTQQHSYSRKLTFKRIKLIAGRGPGSAYLLLVVEAWTGGGGGGGMLGNRGGELAAGAGPVG